MASAITHPDRRAATTASRIKLLEGEFSKDAAKGLAKKENDPSLAITPWLWIRYGTPCMLVTLIICSVVFYFFFDFFNEPIKTIATAASHG